MTVVGIILRVVFFGVIIFAALMTTIDYYKYGRRRYKKYLRDEAKEESL